MESYKKIDRKFTHSDSSINVYGFRLLTSGYVLEEYLKCPIGYYMHNDSDGVLVRWEDVKIEGDLITGYPVINLSHRRGYQTAEEVEAGFVNAASVGDIVILEHTFEPNPKDPENPILVATKWYNKETSLVDKPGNRGELGKGGAFAEPVRLFDASGNAINLSDLSNKNKPLMKKVTLSITPALIGLLALSDNGENTDEGELLSRIKNLSDKAKKVDALEVENTSLKTETATAKTDKETAVKNLADFKKEANAKEVKDLLDGGLEKGKLTKALSDTLATDYADNPAGLKKVLDGMGAYVSLADSLKKDQGEIPEKFKGKNLMDLQKADLLEEVKAGFPDLFDKLKKEHDEAKKK